MKIMVFDVGGTEIKYSVMDEQMNRFDSGSVPTPPPGKPIWPNILASVNAIQCGCSPY